MAKANKPAPEQEAPAAAKPTREESTAYLAGKVLSIMKGERVDERDYKLSVGYTDGRRGGLSEAGVSRFSETPELMEAHKAAREAYPEKAKAIITEHKDILLKMFNAKPGQKGITKEEYAKVAPVLEEPFSRSQEKGGLIYDANKVAKEIGANDVLEAAKNYRETVRVYVLSPLYLADIYQRQNNGKTVTSDEKADLKKGITVMEDGKPVEKPFVENGRLTKFAQETCTAARRMLGGKKGETIDMALQISDSKARRSQIAPPKAPAAPGVDMD